MKKQVHIHEHTRSNTDLLKQDSDQTKIEKRIIKLKNGIDDEELHLTNEFENLDQLDQWKENVTNKKNVYYYEQPIESQQKPNDFNFDGEQGPAINSMILNQIVKYDPKLRKGHKYGQQMKPDKGSGQKNKRDSDLVPSQLKTLEQVRLDMNKKLLNTLLLDKVQRTVDRVQKQQPWSIGQVEGETTTIFSEQARVLKQNTLNNFKGLNEYFRNPAQFIDYEDVLMKAKQYSNKPVSFQHKDNYSQTTQSMQSSKNMLDSYIGIQQKIVEHKKLLYDLRIDNNTLVGEMQKIEEDILQLRRKFYGREERARQGITDQNVNLSPGKRLARSNIVDVLDRLRLQREQEESIRQLGIQQIKMQIQQNSEKQQLIQKELDEFRERKRKCKLALKEMLNSQLLKADQGLCQDSLIQVVKSIRKINEVPKKELFPQYLDEMSINFISRAAMLEQEIDDARAMNVSNHNSTVTTDQIAAITHHANVTEIKQKVRAHFQQNRYLKSTLSQSKFFSADVTNLTSEPTDLTFKATMSHLELAHSNSQHKDVNQRLVYLQQELENLSQKEIQRNVKKYIRRRSEEELKDLRYVYYAYFGAQSGETHWLNFLNSWCEYHNLNPQRLNKFKQDQVGSDNHSSLPVVPTDQATKIKSTMKYLEQEPSVSYNYDLLGQVIKPKTAVTGFTRRYIK